MNAPTFGRDVAPLGRDVRCHGLCPWGSTNWRTIGCVPQAIESWCQRGQENTKILIVDDDERLAHILKAMLENEAHEVRLALDGQDGFLTYLDFRADVVITDIQMPERDGLELTRLIRTHNPSVHTIYISCDLNPYGSVLEDERVRYRACFLQKPFSKDELLRLLSQFKS